MSTVANPSLGAFRLRLADRNRSGGPAPPRNDESTLVKTLLIGGSLAFLTLVLFVPLAAIFAEGPKGVSGLLASFTDPHALSAIR